MTEKCGRNDPCTCGSGKKYKKCCGVQKKLAARNTTVMDASSAGSLLGRISHSSGMNTLSGGSQKSLKDRISKTINDTESKKSE
jgi:hypothetical protein